MADKKKKGKKDKKSRTFEGATGGVSFGMGLVGPGRPIPPGGTRNAKKSSNVPTGTFQKKAKDFSKRKM